MGGSELRWRGQENWEQAVINLQYQSLGKCVSAVRGARKELVSGIAGVENPRMAVDAAQDRMMAKMLGDLWRVLGVAVGKDKKGTNLEDRRAWNDDHHRWSSGGKRWFHLGDVRHSE